MRSTRRQKAHIPVQIKLVNDAEFVTQLLGSSHAAALHVH